ncbi:MAG: DMT family transporter [Pseudomonadota bacterium]
MSTGVSVAWLVASAVAFSSAGVFVRLAALDGPDVVWWRSAFSVVLLGLWLGARGQIGQEVRMGWPGLAIAGVSALGTAAFIPSFLHTSIANVAVIWATAPFVAGALAWLWLRTPPSRSLLLGSALSLVGAASVVSGSLTTGGLLGDALAAVMTVCMAVVICLYRRWPATPVAGPTWLASLLLVGAFAPVASVTATPWSAIAVLAAFAAVFLFASIALMIGARGLHPAHTSLLSALETPIAPALAWWLLAEVPTTATVLGGGLIVVAVMLASCAERG